MDRLPIDTGNKIKPWSGEVLRLAKELRKDLLKQRELKQPCYHECAECGGR